MRRIASAMRLAVATASVLMAACSSGTDGGGSFSFTLSEPSASVAQGAAKAITITITRSDFDKPITFTVEGLPTGVTATFSPSPAAGTSTILQLNALTSTLAATSTITVRGTGEGAADQTASLALTVTVTGSFTLGALDPTVTVAQGGGDRTSVLVNRVGGFGGSVAVAVSGAPSGLTVTQDVTSTAGNSVLLTLSANASLAPGTYTLTASGTSPGVPNQQTTIAVNVIAAPATASLTMSFCAGSIPAWFAYRNEGFPWQTLSATGSTFVFQATSRVAVAFTFVTGAQGVKQTTVIMGTRSEFANWTGSGCPGTKSLSGSVSGLGAAQTSGIFIGSAGATATGTSPTFSFTTVPDRPLDHIATLGVLTSASFSPEKLIVRRAQNPAPNTTLPAFDFAAAEAVAPQQNNLTIGSITSSDALYVENTLWSATGTLGSIQFAQPSSSPVVFFSVPTARLVAGDLHELLIDAYQAPAFLGRTLRSYIAAPGDRTETFGAFVNAPLISSVASAPYVRLRARIDAQTEYGSAVEIRYAQQVSSSDVRVVELLMSAGYLAATPAQWDLAVPDWAGVSGFNTGWMLTQGASVQVTLFAYGGRAELLHGAAPAAGDVLRQSDRQLVISGGNLRVVGGAHPRERGRRVQYFRR